MENGAIDEAILKYQQAVNASPDNVEYLWDLGNVALDAGQFKTAAAPFSKLCKLCPDNPVYFEYIGRAQMGGRKCQLAFDSFNQAVALKHPETALMNQFRVDALLQSNLKKANKEAEIEKVYAELVQINQQDPLAIGLKGYMLIDSDFTSAWSCLVRSIKLGCTCFSFIELVLVFWEKHPELCEPSEMDSLVELIVKNNHKNGRVLLFVGYYYEVAGSFVRAIELFTQALDMGYKYSRYRLGIVQMKRGNTVLAIEACEAAFIDYPEDKAIMATLISLYTESNNHDKAKEMIKLLGTAYQLTVTE